MMNVIKTTIDEVVMTHPSVNIDVEAISSNYLC